MIKTFQLISNTKTEANAKLHPMHTKFMVKIGKKCSEHSRTIKNRRHFSMLLLIYLFQFIWIESLRLKASNKLILLNCINRFEKENSRESNDSNWWRMKRTHPLAEFNFHEVSSISHKNCTKQSTCWNAHIHMLVWLMCVFVTYTKLLHKLLLHRYTGRAHTQCTLGLVYILHVEFCVRSIWHGAAKTKSKTSIKKGFFLSLSALLFCFCVKFFIFAKIWNRD